MVTKKIGRNKPILNYLENAERAIEIPAETLKIFDLYAEYYNQTSASKISPMDVLTSQGIDLNNNSKSLDIQPYEPLVKRSIKLPKGAWSGLDKAAKESGTKDRDVIISISKDLSQEANFLAWLKKKSKIKKGGSGKKS